MGVNKVIRLVFVRTRLYALVRPIFFPRSEERDAVPVHRKGRAFQRCRRDQLGSR
jgi:hypothetical protein